MTDRQAIISMRAILNRQLKFVEAKYRINHKASFRDESSDSYDEMQRRSGETLGLKFAIALIEETLKAQRKGGS